MRKLVRNLAIGAATAALVGAGVAIATNALAHTVGEPGDDTMLVHINDSEAGGSYHQTFELASTTGPPPTARPSTSTSRRAALGGADGVDSLDPAFDHNPDDDFTPCADNSADDYVITQAQINLLGDELASHIVADRRGALR